MFVWDQSTRAIMVPAGQVIHLFRSMRDVQLALPGVSAQEATAYLCQYRTDAGIETVAVFHLHQSDVLAFYFSEPRAAPATQMEKMLNQGLNFVESMGFLLTDQDIHYLDDADRKMLWESLPLMAGLPKTGSELAASGQSGEDIQADPEELTEMVESALDAPNLGAAGRDQTTASAVSASSRDTAESAIADETADANVDDLLAAVEAMRAKRPGLRADRAVPTSAEINRRKDDLRQLVGRIL
ncbi:MAG: hypothetical protein P8Y39_12580, partial [Nitrospirota bacterium]